MKVFHEQLLADNNSQILSRGGLAGHLVEIVLAKMRTIRVGFVLRFQVRCVFFFCSAYNGNHSACGEPHVPRL